MAQVSTKGTWSLTIARLFIGASVLLATIFLGRLVQTVEDQRDERACLFDVTTQTDRIEGDMLDKQAEIFEAAILRPNPGGGSTPELQRLGHDLTVLRDRREKAYEKRDEATKECS